MIDVEIRNCNLSIKKTKENAGYKYENELENNDNKKRLIPNVRFI